MTGRNTQTEVRVEAMMAMPTCLAALDRRAGRGHAAAAQTVDVLDDDDGVIHQHTNAEGQARQRHNIHIQTGEVHEHHANSTDSGILMPTTSVGLISLRKMASTMMARAAPMSILLRMLLTMMLM